MGRWSLEIKYGLVDVKRGIERQATGSCSLDCSDTVGGEHGGFIETSGNCQPSNQKEPIYLSWIRSCYRVVLRYRSKTSGLWPEENALSG